jgi:signal peptidase II
MVEQDPESAVGAQSPIGDHPPSGLGRTSGVDPARRRRLVLTLGLLALGTVLLDQATKAWAVAELTGREPVEVVDGLLRLDLVRNSGAAFSFASGMTWIFTVVASAVSVVIVRVSRRLGSLWWAVSLGLLLGGALGNLLDRLFRAPGFGTGHVVDFLELPHWPVFNVADSCIVAAACVLSLTTLRGIEVDGTRYTPSKDGADAVASSCGQDQGTQEEQGPGRRPEGQGPDV